MDNQEKRGVEQILVLIKPDGLVKSLTGNIISKLSEAKLIIVGAKIVQVSRELAEQHYDKLKEEKGDEIFESVLEYIQGKFHTNRVLAMVYEGEDAIQKVRPLAGATNPEKAEPTTIRGKYGRIHSETEVFENVIHCSDSKDNAKREIQIWFEPVELSNIIYPTEHKAVEETKLVWRK